MSLALCAMLLSGCGGGGDAATTTTTRPPATTTLPEGGATPLEAVTAWLDALAIGRYAGADEMVVQDQFVLVLSVESYSVELYDELVAGGVSRSASDNFWESFVAGVRGFTGAAITEVDVLGERRFEAYGRSFAEVEAESPRGDLSIIAVLRDDGRWLVDLMATFGPSFAPLFNLWVDRLPAEATHPVETLESQRASLFVARDRAAAIGNTDAVAELDGLLERLGG